MGCKLVGTVKGAKLWAGDCMAPELRGATSETDAPTLTERATGVIPLGRGSLGLKGETRESPVSRAHLRCWWTAALC